MSRHPDTALVPLLRNELAPAEHARVSAHIAACAACARSLEETREVLARLGASAPVPPDVHWGAYRARLRERIHASVAIRTGWRRALQPLPLALSAAAAALLVVVAAQTEFSPSGPANDLEAFEEVVIGDHLPLLQQYPVMERLDLLEDLDIIRQLDLLPVREG
ncbi:MAG TPA: zf-HC2 domain-containing protein [Candidatus Limnocylindria bacterium]|nr:zf-HC2 domain-containing protein [Candidatus Limnocylindria bacterium]